MNGMTTIRVVIFDFDDTLMATSASRIEVLITTAKDFDVIISSEDILKHWGVPFNELINTLFPNINYEIFVNHYSRAMKSFPPMLLPGAKALLRGLKSRKIKVYILTSGSRQLVHQDLEYSGVIEFVDRIWGFEDTKYHKPDPRVLRPILIRMQESGIGKKQTIFIGDSVNDYIVADQNGISFLGVLTGRDKRENFLKYGNGVKTVKSLRKLLNYKFLE